MHQPEPATAVLPRQTQAQRRQDLHNVLQLPEGYRFLAAVYRHHFAAGETALPETQEMIARILAKEYPA